MKYVTLLMASLLFHFSAISQNHTLSLGEIQQLTLLDQASADNLLKSKGFSLKNVSGLSFTYSLADETVDLVSTPRSITYTTLNANSYISFNDAVAKEYQLLNAQDVITVNGQSVIATSFAKPGLKISLWTSNGTQVKFHVQSSLSSSVPAPPAAAPAQNNNAIVEALNARSQSTENTTTPTFSGEGLPARKKYFTFGGGLFRFPDFTRKNGGYSYKDEIETLYAINFGMEISKVPTFQKKGAFYVNTRLDINWTSFFDMQIPYITTNAQNEVTDLEILFLRKHYASLGLISEVRRKDTSFLLSLAPGLNLNRGYFDSSNKASHLNGFLQIGEYLQYNIHSTSKNIDTMFIRIGFEQFFAKGNQSRGGDYIGQFALTLGI